MKNNRYFVAGLFIIITTIVMIFIGFWLAFGLKDIKYDTYIARFNESVTGLNVNAAINYNGVNVGKVESINIDKQNPSVVIVVMQIQQGIPIYNTTYASLVPQGITGQVFITLSISSDPDQYIVKPQDAPPFPVVKTKPSFLTNIVNQMSTVAEQVTLISTRVAKIISDDNVQKINHIVSNVEDISNSLATSSQNIHQSIESLNIILKNAAKSSAELDQIAHNINHGSKAVARASEDVSKAITSFNNQTLQGVNNILLPQLAQTLNNINETSVQLSDLLKKMNQNPSILVRGELPRKPGPGEQ
ncbi:MULTISPECIES: MlaD family protein [Cysteiniphilum]|uniref:ABC transporter substrate-binding protein n=1 Tax=Cysteiniphilum litorale TaxID=2056700 RepID=A0A8J2Z2Z7_9GAMM|nr:MULTISPECIES: MlaD family protein [Cysteiniphilum]GGF89041.1 ABC transporter substrate-binding protein [Cysteiniphilum litorale]